MRKRLVLREEIKEKKDHCFYDNKVIDLCISIKHALQPIFGKKHLELKKKFMEEFEEEAHEAEGEVGGLARDRAGHGRADGVVVPEELGVGVDDVEGGHVKRPAARRRSRA